MLRPWGSQRVGHDRATERQLGSVMAKTSLGLRGICSYSLPGPHDVRPTQRAGLPAASVSWFVILFPIEHLEPFSTQTPRLVPHTQGSPFSEPLDCRGYRAYLPMSLPGDFKCNNPPNQIRFLLGAEILPGIFDTGFGPLSSRISPKMVSLHCILDLVAPLSPPAYCIHHSIWFTAQLHAAYFQMIRAVCFQSLLKTGYPLLSSGLFKLL